MGIEQLTPPEFQILPTHQYIPEDRARPFFSLAAIRATFAPELEQLQRDATERMAELSRSYAAALDAAATLLLANGRRDIARVLQPNGVDELWIDTPADRQLVGEVMPGRCVYRQRMSYEDGKVSIEQEWLDPELAAVAAQARTVLPGQPVTYHGGIMLGTPIPAEPLDPSKIIGVVNFGPAEPEPELPPIPPAGFYWARICGADRWEPVEVENASADRVVSIGTESYCTVTEWGPALYPPGTGIALDESAGKCAGCAVPIHRGNGVNHVGDRPWHTQCLVRSLQGTVEALQKRYDERKAQRLTYVEAQLLKGALGAALLPAPFGFEPEVSRKLTGEEHAALEAAIERAMVQPAECRHDAWEWPMARCPACGTEGR